MDWLNYANQGATRNQPIAPELAQALGFLPEMGITMDVFSGGQPAQGSGGARVGSVRHDDGGSADVFFNQNGRRLDWANPDDVPIYQDIVRRARANGVTGFGAGDGYMQPGSMHVGFGTPAVWGAGGRGTNAPRWLREAYNGAPAGQQPTVNTRNAADTPQAIGRDTRSALGLLQNEGNEMAQPQQPQRPQGLLSSLGVQRRDPNAQGETSQPFYNRQSFGDTMARLAPALGRMGVMGLEGPAQAALDSRNQRQGDERAQQAQAAQRNQTIEWLVSNGREDLAGAVQSGGLPIGEAMSLAMAPAEAPPEQFRQVTGAELGMEGESAGMMFNVGPDGKITAIGGSGVNVDITNDMGGGEIDPDAALRAGLSEGLVKEFGTYRTAGSAASASLGDLNTLQELAALAPEGPISGRLAQAFPEFNDVAALRDAIVKRVGPSLRAEGSGSTSDIEYQGMLDSLGNMRNTREANAAIIAVMQAKAQFNIARADIVNRMMGDTNYTQAQAMQDLTALDQSSGIPDQVRSLISSYGNGGATPPAGGGGLSPEADAFMRGN
jgi:hypothetical protein